jgi:sugar phosphate isomerase/epimerase
VNPLTRRQALGTFIGAPALFGRKGAIDRSRISIITDEAAKDQADSIAFARKYKLQWLELRGVPGNKRSYFTLPEPDLRAAAREFKESGIRISFLNTGMLKFGLPGTMPSRRKNDAPDARARREEQEKAQFERRLDDLNQAIRAAHILEVDKVRVFAFTRVDDPMALMPRIADILGEMVKIAEKEKVRLLMENEASCNVGSCAELAAVVKMVPSRYFGINWDPLNALSLKETPFPEGYALLPKKKIWNVQIKGHSLRDGPRKLDWRAIFRALEKDGYMGQVGLETHIFDEPDRSRLIEHSHACMQEILRLVQQS